MRPTRKLQEPLHKARTCLKMGRFELAAGFYREALGQAAAQLGAAQ